MRVTVIGTPRERRALRSLIEHSPPEIVGEFDSLAEAQQSGITTDAVVLAPRGVDHGAEVESFLPEALTPREVQVLELLAEGLTNKAIAERLDISDQTVKFHIASLTGKLGAANRTDAVRRGVRRGLIAL